MAGAHLAVLVMPSGADGSRGLDEHGLQAPIDYLAFGGGLPDRPGAVEPPLPETQRLMDKTLGMYRPTAWNVFPQVQAGPWLRPHFALPWGRVRNLPAR